MPANIKAHIGEITGSAISASGAGGAIAAWQAQLAWGVTIIAGLVAIVSGFLTIRSLVRKEKKGE